MEQRNKRPRVQRHVASRKFKALYPEYLGFDPSTEVVFSKTQNGYKAKINSGAWIGFPRYVIEGNRHLFEEI